MMHSTPEQNRAHHRDLIWMKVGASEYMRGDGVIIRKDTRTRGWVIILPGGRVAAMPRHLEPGRVFEILRACAHSLTEAKRMAELVTAESPAVMTVDEFRSR
jgi:hypothetical protein